MDAKCTNAMDKAREPEGYCQAPLLVSPCQRLGWCCPGRGASSFWWNSFAVTYFPSLSDPVKVHPTSLYLVIAFLDIASGVVPASEFLHL